VENLVERNGFDGTTALGYIHFVGGHRAYNIYWWRSSILFYY
jgi:hypothetical protein